MDIPQFAVELMEAYRTTSGIPLALSESRKHTLSEIHARGLNAQDIISVLSELKKLIRQNIKGYSDRSLDWRNCMADVDVLEERCLRLRQRALRQQKPKPQEQIERNVGSGVLRVLDDPEPKEAQRIDVRGSLLNLANSLKQQSA